LVGVGQVYGAASAGIYVGQGGPTPVRDSVVAGNVAGIEHENSTDAVVVNKSGRYAAVARYRLSDTFTSQANPAFPELPRWTVGLEIGWL